MGLRITQTTAAMNAYRNLRVTDGQMAKSLEKLSSGCRINWAADDAAGLSISEGLRAQLGGLKVAVRNAQTELTQRNAELNRLEHTISNLSVAAENLSASESRIRDTDMAQEMVFVGRMAVQGERGFVSAPSVEIGGSEERRPVGRSMAAAVPAGSNIDP